MPSFINASHENDRPQNFGLITVRLPLRMWPFTKKQRFSGIKENADGTIEFSLTDEEAREADTALYAFKGVLVHPDYAERVRNGTVAVALCRHAKDCVTQRFVEAEDTEDRAKWAAVRDAAEKAVASVWKSYSLFPLPIFLYHRACFLQMIKRKDEARQLFTAFLKEQAEFKIDDVTEALIKHEAYDIDNAILHARREA